MLFYFTPVFYDLARLPHHYQSLLRLNPMTTIVDAYHSIVLGGRLPAAGWLGAVTLLSVVVAAAGMALFTRVSPGFVDELWSGSRACGRRTRAGLESARSAAR